MSAKYRMLGKFTVTDLATAAGPWVPDRVAGATLTFLASAGTPTVTIKVSNDPEADIGDAATLATGLPISAPYQLIATTARYAKYWFVASGMDGASTLTINLCATMPF